MIVECNFDTVVAELGMIKSLLFDLPMVVRLDSKTNLFPARAPSWNFRLMDFLFDIFGSFLSSKYLSSKASFKI